MKQKPSELNGKPEPTTRQLLQWCLLPLFVVLACAACKQAKVAAESSPKAAADTNPAGTYALVSVDGNKVPGTVQHQGQALAVKSGTFIINPDGTCSSKVVFGPPSGGESAREVKATYTREGSKLTMRWEGAGTTTGTVEGDTFTMNNEGMIFAYRK